MRPRLMDQLVAVVGTPFCLWTTVSCHANWQARFPLLAAIGPLVVGNAREVSQHRGASLCARRSGYRVRSSPAASAQEGPRD
jgi:hypothetical protein